MSDAILERADEKIDINDFTRLLHLNSNHSWLLNESKALFELWCLSENEEQKSLIEFLINNFSFIDGKSLTKGCQRIAEYIEDEWNLTPNNTFLTALSDDSKPDGSQALIQSLKNKFSNSWREFNFFNTITVSANNIPSNSNLIIVDDFIGTGTKISRKLKYVKDTIHERKLRGVSISIVSLAAMNFSKEILNSLNLKYFSVYWLKKGITELMPCEQRGNAIKSMEELEEKLQNKCRGGQLPNFGYMRSESLFALEFNNIPNNVFPIFWWPTLKGGKHRRTLFKRVY